MIEITSRMEIDAKPEEIFNAFVDPQLIGNFWFSTSSEAWEADKDIILTYDEFDAEIPIHILNIRKNQMISLSWGPSSDERAVTITITPKDHTTVVEVKEVGFQEFEDMLTDPTLSEVRTYEYESIINQLMGGKASWTFVLACLKAYLEHGVTTIRTGYLG
ncbi:MAG: SRPBCC domain-containing protein [Streptococcaceae bacterium]|nr:SRPBCC domain-containing protein [Streptococcaceae bacterium]